MKLDRTPPTVLCLALLSLLALPAPGRAQEDDPTDPEQEGLPLPVGHRLSYTATEGSWMSST